jgi:DNA polymerase-3 subunit epsilon
MGQLAKDSFVCLDCETTGLDTEKDKIIEIAAIKFTFEKTIDKTQSLVNPEIDIPHESWLIHNISNEMVYNKPTIKTVLPDVLKFIGNSIIVGHGIKFDIDIVSNEAKRINTPCTIKSNRFIDTLRLARLYGGSPGNSLEKLREHFNVPNEGAHRAMSDVIVNISVFKHLTTKFQTTESILTCLDKPVLMQAMPLGKHKGRSFSDIPLDYLRWAAGKDFDQDLLYSLRMEIKNRKKGANFQQSTSPFSLL